MATGMLEFLSLLGKLKTTKRTGWVNNNIHLPESISDHIVVNSCTSDVFLRYRMAIMSMVVDDPNINKDHAMKVALVHDMAESIVGDITPHDGVSDEDKYEMEKKGMENIRSMLGDNPAGEELYNLWMEYEECKTPEAQLVKQIDKLEMIVQAYEYERDQGKNLDGFYKSVEGKISHPSLKKWLEDLLVSRSELPK